MWKVFTGHGFCTYVRGHGYQWDVANRSPPPTQKLVVNVCHAHTLENPLLKLSWEVKVEPSKRSENFDIYPWQSRYYAHQKSTIPDVDRHTHIRVSLCFILLYFNDDKEL